MKIHVARGSGFCFGVKRAMDMAYKYADDRNSGEIYSLKQIIHNPQEAARLEQKGIKRVEEAQDVKSGTSVIVSTHGITQHQEEILKGKNIKILDLTCPYVKKIHIIVKRLTEDGCQVIIVGDKNHLEVKGIFGWAINSGVVISSKNDVKKILLKNKFGIVSQTTQNVEEYREIVNCVIKKGFDKKCTKMVVYNTICDATQKRQEATVELAKKVDTLVIIGGKNSANTKRLFKLSRKILRGVHLVETEKEIKTNWFKGKKNIGISAGASTPSWVINRVIKKIGEAGQK